MSSDKCELIQLELSAYIDDELGPGQRRVVAEHLATCRDCTREESALRAVRRLVRVHPVEDIPDLAPAIMATIHGRVAEQRGGGWREHFRVGAVAAAAAALVVFGASLPFDRPASDVAAAGEITENVRAAARSLDTYSASFSIVERGWHRAVPERHMTATVDFAVPENIRLEVRDHTDYPSAQWPRNDVTLVATSNRWWIEEPSSCPAVALPECAAPTTWAGVIERRVVDHRQPFDGTSPLPTDIVLPLETLAASDGFEVLGRDTVAGRETYRLGLSFRQAVPLVAALEVGGAWREFHPLDDVELWIDAETWFPLRFTVSAGTSPDREIWTTARDLTDRPGDLLLDVTATHFEETGDLPSGTFEVPSSGLRRDGGFEQRPVKGTTPAYTANLDPYRSGTTPDGLEIETFTSGMSYLKVVRTAGSIPDEALRTAEELELGTGYAYYLPATEMAGRRVEISFPNALIELQSNLPRAELIEVAASLPVAGRRAPSTLHKASGVTITRIDPRRAFDQLGFTHEPSYLPSSYRLANATRSETPGGTENLTLLYRRPQGEFDGDGIRIVQSAPVAFLSPSSEEFIEVRLGQNRGRWSIERGELEWIDGDTYRAVAVPAADLYTALRIAEGLE